MVNVHDNGTYLIVNDKGGTAIDLSGDDNTTVHGWEIHGGDNQKWTVHRTDDGWHIKNVAVEKYLSLASAPGNDVAVIGSDEPFLWHLWPENGNEDDIRVCVPNTRKGLDLNDHGNSANGTPIKIWGRWEARNQVWKFQRV